MLSVPIELQYLWDWYRDLSASRTAGFNVNAITWSDLWGFFSLRQITPQQWEVDTIRDIDAAYLASRVSDVTAVAKSASAFRKAGHG